MHDINNENKLNKFIQFALKGNDKNRLIFKLTTYVIFVTKFIVSFHKETGTIS